LLYSKYAIFTLLFTLRLLFAVQQIRSVMVHTEAEIVHKLVGTLNEMPNSHAEITMESLPGDRAYDAQVEGIISGKPVTLLIEVKNHVYPRDVHQYLYYSRETAKLSHLQSGGPVVLLLAAQSISPGAKELLREERKAYFDSGGSLYLNTNNLFVDRERPPAPSEERVIRTLFTGTRARVLLSLLDRPQEWINVSKLSRDAEVSTATASEVLQAMERNDWVMSEGAGPHKQRRVIRPEAVLDAWTKFVETRKPPKLRRFYIPQSNLDLPHQAAKFFDQHEVEYAMTGEAAAQHYAPWLTHISVLRFRLVYSENAEAALSGMGAKLTTEGTNLSILEVPSSKDIQRRDYDNGIWYAHPIQVYLDLLKLEGRARDAANHLREERIRF
jgi:hypothetical protein